MNVDSNPLTVAPSKSYQKNADSFLQELPEQYQLLGCVGEGGMGSVFKAQNRYTGSQFAIKVMRFEFARDPEAWRRFAFEAKAASLLKHPHICQVHDFGLSKNGMPYLVMDWIDGISLEEKVLKEKRLTSDEGIEIFQQVAAALAHAHQHKVIHRDIKPHNIMISQDQSKNLNVHIVDFGLAKAFQDENNSSQSHGLTQTGTIVGSPMYMSPEQARATNIDKRTDIYSLGCVMYFAFTGDAPFAGASSMDIISKHLNELPPVIDPALKISADLKMIIFNAMEKKPRDRYQSMEQLALDLDKLEKGVRLKHRVLSGEKLSFRRRLIIGLSFILAFLITYAISVGLQNLIDSSNPHADTKLSGDQKHLAPIKLEKKQ